MEDGHGPHLPFWLGPLLYTQVGDRGASEIQSGGGMPRVSKLKRPEWRASCGMTAPCIFHTAQMKAKKFGNFFSQLC